MTRTFINTKFRRDCECTNIVAIKCETLPAQFSPDVFKDTGDDAPSDLTRLWIEHQDGQRIEVFGHL